MIYNNILEAVGHTPMVRLNNMTDENSAEIYAKFEGLNVGGSIKTRTALNMIKKAEKAGKSTRIRSLLSRQAAIRVSGSRLWARSRATRPLLLCPIP